MRYFVGDTETASDVDGCGVCEIALIEIDNDLNYITHFGSRIDPEEPICPSASGVHGITNCMVESEPTLQEWFNLVGLSEVCLAAHNARFDIDKIQKCVTVPLSIDTLRLATRFIEGSPNYKLGTLTYFCKLPKPTGDLHGAMVDSWCCYHLLTYLAEVSGLKTFTELAAESNTPRLLEKFPPFGKHANDKFSDVPTQYLQWCLKNFERMDMDLEFSINQRLGR